MLLAVQLGYLGRGRWSSGTFPVRWQCTQTWLWWHNAGICCATEPRPTNDWVLQCVDHTLTEPFLVSAPLAEELWKEKREKVVAVLAGHRNSEDCRKQGAVAWKHAACKGPVSMSFMVLVTDRWATGQPSRWSRLQPSRQHSVSWPFSSTVQL